jgi:hypothetical protein
MLNEVQQAVRFLNALFVDGDIILGRPIETWLEHGRKKQRVIYNATDYAVAPNRLDQFVEKQLQVSSDERANVFFGVCPRFGGKGHFDLAWQVRIVRAIWTDIDHLTVEVARERVAKAGLPLPSILVSSGSGVHVYWLLDRPYLIDDAGDPPPVLTEWTATGKGKKPFRYFVDCLGEKIDIKKKALCPKLSPKAQHFQDLLGGLAAKIGGDHTTDLSRLLRIAGTMNRKNERNGDKPIPCTLVELHPDLRYNLAVFQPLVVDSPGRARRLAIEAIRLPTTRATLSAAKQDRLNLAISASESANCGHRSEPDFAVGCEAIRCGVDKEQLWSQVQDIGKFKEAGKDYFDRTWEAASAEVRLQTYERQTNK